MSAAIRLEVRDVCKEFPGVRALDGVELQVAAQEVHALLGENGAGKSTLLKILSGALRADRGEATLEGIRLEASESPRDRQRLGLITIYQEFNLLPFMSIAENLYLGREPTRRAIIDWPPLYDNPRVLLDGLGIIVAPRPHVLHFDVPHHPILPLPPALLPHPHTTT